MFERLLADERAVEGLPIRLVVGLVVGVASLSVIMNMLSGVATLGVTELDVQLAPEVTEPGNATVTVRVVEPSGDPVANATVVARDDSSRLDGVTVARTNVSGVATFALDPKLGANQPDGTVAFEVKPPAGSGYVDRRENTKLLVVVD